MAILTVRGYIPDIILTASQRRALFRSPVKGTVVRVSVFPSLLITGAATNNRTHNVFNGGAAGTGVVSIATRNYGNGINAPANAETPLILSATPANLAVAKGDIIHAESLTVGTGILEPGSLFEVDILVGLD